MERVVIFWLIVTLTGSCTGELPVDRRESPGAAFESAKSSLRRRDAHAFYDSLGDKTALFLFKNTVNICMVSNGPEAERLGLIPLPKCMFVLKAHGWKVRDSDSYSDVEVDEFAKNVEDWRRLAGDLDASVRSDGSGSSFVWEHMEGVEVVEIREEGNIASGIVDWDGEKKPVSFYSDSSGWRMESLFDGLEKDA